MSLELGWRLEMVGVLDTPEEVFHLRLEELALLGEPWPPDSETVARIRALVVRHKANRKALATQPIFDLRLLAVDSDFKLSRRRYSAELFHQAEVENSSFPLFCSDIRW